MMTSLMRMTMTTTTSPRAAHRARRELEENVARYAESFSLAGRSLRSLLVDSGVHDEDDTNADQ